MSDVIIRPAMPADQGSIRQIVRHARLDPTGLHWSHFLVAVKDKRIIGIGQIRPATPELGSLVVDEAHRGQGIGGRLVEQLIDLNEGPLYLECQAKVAPYYERFGFTRIPWHAAPPPLRYKAMMGTLFTLGGLAVMRHPGGEGKHNVKFGRRFV